jgi:hypothetical protein
MRQRFVGVWEDDHQRFEFRPDGYLRAYRPGERHGGSHMASWRISDGNLALVSNDFPLKNGSLRRRIENAAQGIVESLRRKQTALFAIEVESADTITITLVEEWGAAPKHYQKVTLKRVSEQLPP